LVLRASRSRERNKSLLRTALRYFHDIQRATSYERKGGGLPYRPQRYLQYLNKLIYCYCQFQYTSPKPKPNRVNAAHLVDSAQAR
ncbi:hypothetical protein ANOM_006539, partial [Aspergillus nomiae NRRL 13137]